MILSSLLKLTKKRPFCSAVIAAAGSSRRMNGENKMFSELCGIPVIARTLLTFQNSEYIDEIVISARSEDIVAIGELCGEYKIDKAVKVICGGDTRPESVFIGLSEISKKAELVAIQDGDRPLVTCKIIEKAVKAAEKYKAAVPAVPVIDTLKRGKDGFIAETVDRSELFAVQTPQVFRVEIIRAALKNAFKKGMQMTDDCMAAEALGVYAKLTEGSYENIKITTPSDIETAEAILRRRER